MVRRFEQGTSLLVIDPGGSSGVVYGQFGTEYDNLRSCIEEAEWSSETITGSELEQAYRLAEIWRELIDEGTSVQTALVIEDYVQGPSLHALQREVLMPIRVTWALLGMLAERHGTRPRVIFQMPGQRVKEARLKIHGAWIPGRVHERAAMGHVLRYLSERLHVSP